MVLPTWNVDDRIRALDCTRLPSQRGDSASHGCPMPILKLPQSVSACSPNSLIADQPDRKHDARKRDGQPHDAHLAAASFVGCQCHARSARAASRLMMLMRLSRLRSLSLRLRLKSPRNLPCQRNANAPANLPPTLGRSGKPPGKSKSTREIQHVAAACGLMQRAFFVHQ